MSSSSTEDTSIELSAEEGGVNGALAFPGKTTL